MTEKKKPFRDGEKGEVQENNVTQLPGHLEMTPNSAGKLQEPNQDADHCSGPTLVNGWHICGTDWNSIAKTLKHKLALGLESQLTDGNSNPESN